MIKKLKLLETSDINPNIILCIYGDKGNVVFCDLKDVDELTQFISDNRSIIANKQSKEYIISQKLLDTIFYKLSNEGYIDLKWQLKREVYSRPYHINAQDKIDTVIKELKQKKNDALQHTHDGFIDNDNYYQGLVKMSDDIIALLQ